MTSTTTTTQTLTHANREEYHHLLLEVTSGQLPTDIYGVVYFSSPVGTVESGGLPYSSGQEQGSSLFNGDGMILKVDFSTPGKATVSAQILKTPCYHADAVVSTVPPGDEYYAKGFFNVGISRVSSYLGVRNQLNTAMIPLRLPGESVDRILATFDTGRPYEFDPVSLQLYHPLGRNLDWRAQYFPMVEYVFPMIAATAHPAYDPRTGEFFSVNYSKDLRSLAFPHKSPQSGNAGSLIQRLGRALRDFLALWEDLEQVSDELEKRDAQAALQRHFEQRWDDASGEDSSLEEEELQSAAEQFLSNQNAVFVVKRDAGGELHSWRVLDPQGNDILITESMHQTGITEDYFVFIDSSFKVSLDILVPCFPQPWSAFSQFLRGFLQTKLKDYTTVYLVRRSDLSLDRSWVKAACVQIPNEETVHFAVNYLNPDQVVTLHTAHNSSLCAAEWVRPFDRLALAPDEPLDPEVIGLPTIGEMDVSRIGKLQIKLATDVDGDLSAELRAMELICEPLSLADLRTGTRSFQELGPNTWGIGLSTYRGALSPDQVAEEVPYIFWQMYGLDYQTLTQHIYDLYSDASNTIAPEELLEYTAIGIPFSIVRQNTQSMELEDWFYFPHDHYLRSLQFVPKNSVLPPGLSLALHGYLVCTVLVQLDVADPGSFVRQIWLFDAAQLAAGPVCRLGHPDLSFAFTIHSAWLPNPQRVDPAWDYDLRQDYGEVLATFRNQGFAEEIRAFMEEEVFPRVEG